MPQSATKWLCWKRFYISVSAVIFFLNPMFQQLQAMDQLLKKRDQALQSAKMVVKFRDNAIAILERGQKPSDVGAFVVGCF